MGRSKGETIQDTVATRGGLAWPPLVEGRLIRRYKRFLADVRTSDGDLVTAHCPNTGSMKACSDPGQKVYLSHHPSARRKLKYTWELIQMPNSLVGVNTQMPNRLVAHAVRRGRVPELRGYTQILPESRTLNRSRIDLLLREVALPECYVEIKNCTFVENGMALFPDAVTARGRKHLEVLQQLVAQGARCVMFYLVQRMDAQAFAPADRIDPAYGETLRRSIAAGVEILVYDVQIDLQGIALNRRLPCRL